MNKIKVRLNLRTLRIGSRERTERSDLPVFHVELLNGKAIVVTSSSIKGLLRRSAEKVLFSGKFKGNACSELIKAYKSLFGGSKYFSLECSNEDNNVILRMNGDEAPTQSKLRFIVEPVSDVKMLSRASIRVNDMFLSVEKRALWDYEFLEVKAVDFVIISVKEMNDYEKALLYLALNNLKHESLGGFGSRGIGIIEGIEFLDEEFPKEARIALDKVMG